MNITTIIKPNYYFTCPSCNKHEYNYTHLVDSKKPSYFGPWYCKECGNGFVGKVMEDNSIKMNTKYIGSNDKTLILLKFSGITLDPKDSFYIIIKGNRFDKEEIENQQEFDKYHYEEHTCAINYLRCPTIFRGDTDYHGIFTHIKTIPYPSKDGYFALVGYGSDNDYDLPWGLSNVDLSVINELFKLEDGQKIVDGSIRTEFDILLKNIKDRYNFPLKYNKQTGNVYDNDESPIFIPIDSEMAELVTLMLNNYFNEEE